MDYIITLSDEEEKALSKVAFNCNKTNQAIIKEQYDYYIKQMLLSELPIPIPPESIQDLNDGEQKVLFAKVINNYPDYVSALKQSEKNPTVWERIKAIIGVT
jgi:predicted DNA-binding protein